MCGPYLACGSQHDTCTFANTYVCLHGLVHLCPYPQLCACLHLDLSCFQCVSAQEGPPGEGMHKLVSEWEPSAPGQLTWGQGLGSEASGWLSTPGGRWDAVFPWQVDENVV